MADEAAKASARGRPSLMHDAEYRDEVCEQVVVLGAEGKSECQISAAIGVRRTTMRSWADRYPEFSSALTRAKELEQNWWETAGQGGLSDKNFNANLWNKTMSARFRAEYGDKSSIEHTGKDGKDLIPDKPRDDLELARYMASILTKATKQDGQEPQS